jgi:hypothetical protein
MNHTSTEEVLRRSPEPREYTARACQAVCGRVGIAQLMGCTGSVLSAVGRGNARQTLRRGGPLQLVLPPLELVGCQGGDQGAGRAEQDPGGGVGQPVGAQVGLEEPHHDRERHRGGVRFVFAQFFELEEARSQERARRARPSASLRANP